MAEYSKDEIRRIEEKWRSRWITDRVFRAIEDPSRPKYYVLDMFPYPSGAGLHVGHPLGYIASDIVARFKRSKGYNVLHPMGFDAFGLPAEQYAIQTGQHPALVTDRNIATYKKQLEAIGLSFDWDREVKTSDPSFYKWTQWIFKQLFNSWYNKKSDRTESIESLVAAFAQKGNSGIEAACEEGAPIFTAAEWAAATDRQKEDILQRYRIAFQSETMVNWCEALGTVLSNDEVKDGVSERGGYPVERKKMLQWSMRISAYAERLLKGLDTIDWPEPLKEMQRNWIGKSEGARISFKIKNSREELVVFTTRPDTIFGVDFMVIAPEHDLVKSITTKSQESEIESYLSYVAGRSEIDRMAEVKKVTGCFTGAFVLHPFTGREIPIWISEYVLAGYGTGAIMAVPCGDERDFKFAKHFNLPITNIIGAAYDGNEANPTYEAVLENSDFLNGLIMRDAIKVVLKRIEEINIGTRKVNYRMRDAIFGRQRYWGEPFPVYYDNAGIPRLVDDKDLPVELPEIDEYKPTSSGEPPLGRAKGWQYKSRPFELTTMPGWAGSSWYWFRYMDPHNSNAFCSKEHVAYWKNVDLYIGGSEHATGHLLYSRFWNKALKDLGYADSEEPFLKLINQGHIQGISKLAYRINGTNKFVSYNLRGQYEVTPIHLDVNFVDGDILDIERFKNWRDDLKDIEVILEDGKYICGSEVEKMSKRYYNVVNPDDIVEKYGADTLRLYEMFLGPLEQSKPWNTNGIDGVYKFLRRFWNLFHEEGSRWKVTDEEPTPRELKTLHKTLRKVEQDIEGFSFNTSVSEFMICANELTSVKCNKRAILEPLVIAIAPFAPHIAEELWEKLGHKGSVMYAPFVSFNPAYLVENSFEYPISINGKVRAMMNFALDMPKEDIEKLVLASETVRKWSEGKPPKKVIIVPGKIVNVVL